MGGGVSTDANFQTEFKYLDYFKVYSIFSDFTCPTH